MTVYMIHHSPAIADELGRYLKDTFESIRVSDTAWFIATDRDMDELDEQLADVADDTKLLIVVEIKGDFSMQGLPDQQMVWIDQHCGS
ncbi:MAG: hypothetical protein V2A56_07940 [bacterium]